MITNPTAAEIIKQGTALSHAATEKALIKHIKNIRSAKDYAALLSCLYGYFQPLEKQLEPWLTGFLAGYEQRRKAGSILNDIRVLGQQQPLLFAHQLPAVTDHVEALACFYVLEGSILGGAVIKKIIGGQCPQLPETVFSFFSGYGERTMELWRSFLAQFNTQIISEQQLQQAIVAANDCFASLEAWIKEYFHNSPASS